MPERKQKGRSPAGRGALLQQVLNSSLDAVFAVDRDFRLLFNNQQHQKALVDSGGHLLKVGESVLSADYTLEVRRLWSAAYEQAFRGEDFKLETKWTSVEGRQQVYENTFSPLRDTTGKIVGALVVGHDITARKRTEVQLAADVDAMSRLRKLATMFVGENHLDAALSEVVDTAMAIAGADFGNIQLLDPVNGELRIKAQRGFPQWWLDFWNSVAKGKGVCGTALERGERVIVEDVEQSPVFLGTPALDMQRRAGVRAVQSTPLNSRSGRLVGMFSTHYRTPRRPDDRALRLLDLLARQAADLIEQAQAETALRESRALLQSFYDSASFMMGVVELEGDKIVGLEANAKVAAFFGSNPERMAGREGREINRDDSITDLWLNNYRQSQRKGGAVRFEYEHPTQSGRVWLSASVAPLPTSGTARPRFSFVVDDITERKRAEEVLRQHSVTLERRVAERTAELRVSESRLQDRNAELEQLYRTAPVGLCELDRELRYVRINDQMAKMNGKSAAEHLGRTPWEIVPEVAAEHTALLRRVLTSGQPMINVEFHGIIPGDRSVVRNWIASYYPLKSGRGAVEGVSAVVVEITELKQAQAALQEREEVFSSIVGQATDAITLIDSETGRFVEFNTAAHEDLGYTRGEFAGFGVADIQAEHTPEVIARNIAAIDREGSLSFDTKHRRRDGQVRDVHVRAKRITIGRRRAFVAVWTDITERKRAEAELAQSREALRALTARLEELREQERQHLSREIHDTFGHALTEWKFDLAWLKRRLAEVGLHGRSAVLRKLAIMSQRADTEMESVRRIAGELRPALLDTVGLAPAIEWLAANFQARTRIRCQVKFTSALPPLDARRKTAIFRILQELLDNVVRHAQASRVEIRLHLDGKAVEMRVRDNGRGISGQALANPIALGLLGIRERAGTLGGAILIRGVRGKGTTATVRLPLLDAVEETGGTK